MKQPKINDLVFDGKGTGVVRKTMKKAHKIKITINIDEDSLAHLRRLADASGTPYQKLLNQALKEGLGKWQNEGTRLDRIERELQKIKQQLAA